MAKWTEDYEEQDSKKLLKPGETLYFYILPKQEYCYRRCLNQDVVVQGNPRVYKALKQELAAVLAELQRIEAGNGIDEELLNLIELVSVILGGLKGEEQKE